MPLARNLGAGIGVAAAGAVITAVAGSVALAAAQDGAVVHELHAAAQTAFLCAAVLCAAALPLVRLVR